MVPPISKYKMLQIIADETKLNCKCLVLQSHLKAMLSKSVTPIPNTSNTMSHNNSEIKHSKKRCFTVSISLQRQHSRGFGIPLFLRLSLVITLFWEKSHKKYLDPRRNL
jgi:hypothetical protein